MSLSVSNPLPLSLSFSHPIVLPVFYMSSFFSSPLCLRKRKELPSDQKWACVQDQSNVNLHESKHCFQTLSRVCHWVLRKSSRNLRPLNSIVFLLRISYHSSYPTAPLIILSFLFLSLSHKRARTPSLFPYLSNNIGWSKLRVKTTAYEPQRLVAYRVLQPAHLDTPDM